MEYDSDDLAGVDMLIRRAQELPEDAPQKKVRSDPEKYGWGG